MISTRLRKLFRKVYYKYIADFQYYTVVLRGSLTLEEKSFLNNHPNFVKNIKKTFQNDKNKTKILEIGFGNGGHLKMLCDRFKNRLVSIYGVELDKVGVFRLLKLLDNNKNTYVVSVDARSFIKKVEKEFFETIFVLYSDPWTRKRDLKRRLLNEDFVNELLIKINKGGQLILATDVESYQKQIENILEKVKTSGSVQVESIIENEINSVKTNLEFDLQEIFNTKFALRAKKEGRINKVYIVTK